MLRYATTAEALAAFARQSRVAAHDAAAAAALLPFEDWLPGIERAVAEYRTIIAEYFAGIDSGFAEMMALEFHAAVLRRALAIAVAYQPGGRA